MNSLPHVKVDIKYKDVDIAISYSHNVKLHGYYSEKIKFQIPETGKNFSFEENRFFDSERQCVGFLTYLAEKIVDNNFEFKKEEVLSYFLERDYRLSPEERKKILAFNVETNKKFADQMLELNSSDNEKRFLEVYASVRDEMISERDLFTEQLENVHLRKGAESIEYLRWISGEREPLYQGQMKKIDDIFIKKFKTSIFGRYSKTSEYKKTVEKSKATSFKDSKSIDWNDPKNILIGFLVVIVLIFLFAASVSNQPSNRDKIMSEQAKKIYKDSGGKTIDCSGSVTENKSVCDYLMSLPDNSNLPEPSRSFPY